MKKFFYIVLFILFCLYFCTSLCFAQKTTIDRIGTWRQETCKGLELCQLIKTYKNDAVKYMTECCKKHQSACLDTYSGPDNKTLLYTAIEQKSYSVAIFLFNLSTNYAQNIDAYGMTVDIVQSNIYYDVIETQGDPTSKTPLMLACYNGDLEATKLLIGYGASLLKKNFTKEGKTNKNAYEYAQIAPHKDPGFMEYVQKEYTKQLELYGKNENKTDLKFLNFTEIKEDTGQFL